MKSMTREEAKDTLAVDILGWVKTYHSTRKGYIYAQVFGNVTKYRSISEWNPWENMDDLNIVIGHLNSRLGELRMASFLKDSDSEDEVRNWFFEIYAETPTKITGSGNTFAEAVIDLAFKTQ